jgi:hypothetical protein
VRTGNLCPILSALIVGKGYLLRLLITGGEHMPLVLDKQQAISYSCGMKRTKLILVPDLHLILEKYPVRIPVMYFSRFCLQQLVYYETSVIILN